MSSGKWVAVAVPALLSALLAACSSDPRIAGRAIPEPGKPGLYALTVRDDLQRLDGDREWEIKTWPKRSELNPGIGIVARHWSLARYRGSSAQPPIELKPVAWLRSEISSTGTVAPIAENNWVEADAATAAIPLEVYWRRGSDDVVYARPHRPLEPGLYVVRLGTVEPPLRARLGVGWGAVDKRAYSTTHCVDRYPGGKPEYRTCGEQSEAIAEADLSRLRVHLVEPEWRKHNDQSRLIVKGVVVNTADVPVKVPSLHGRIMDRDGATLKEWPFTLAKQVLQPGESAAFSSEVENPPADTSRINVNFTAPNGRPRLIEVRR